MDSLRRPYDEFERVKNNRPHPNVDPMYPKTTDGTTASQIRLAPRRAIQQVPYGKVEVDGEEALSCLADYLLVDEIIPHSNTQDNVLGKSWKSIEDIFTYGSTDAIIFYKQDGEYFGTDWRVPYKKDIYLEANKGTFSECNYYFIRAWYQKTDIQNIIDKEKALIKSAKSRGEKYTPTWDVALLEEIIKEGSKTEKDSNTQTDSEKDRQVKAEGYEIIHAYQKGIGAMFYSWVPTEEKMARKWKNPDPRGVPPIHRMYFECDLSNPEGRGIVELVAPLQNYLDSSLQAQQYTKALMYNPPLIKKGSYNRSQIKYAPNAIIDIGSDPNSSLAPLNLNNTALSNFSQDFGLIKSQILNLFGGDDQSVSSTVGNPGFSKTDAGVNARQAIIGVNDNFIRKRYEQWLGEIFCTQINLYFALTEGDREFTPDTDTLAKLEAYGPNDYFEVMDNKVIVHFSNINDKQFQFETEASTSKAPDTNESKDHFLEAIKTINENGLIQFTNPQEIVQRIFVQAGVDDSEKLMAQEQPMDPMMDPNAQLDENGQPIDPNMQMPEEMPQEQMQAPEMQQEQQEPVMTPEDEAILQNLLQAGYPPEVAYKGWMLEKQGYEPEQIDQILQQELGGQ